jgi:hypothetical protein
MRQIPDTQEVFLYPDLSISVIVEILQRVDVPNFLDAIKLSAFHLSNSNIQIPMPHDRYSKIPLLLTGTRQLSADIQH